MGEHQAVMVRYQLRNFSKTSKRPRRSYDKERLDAELKLIGTYGLKNKREIWRVGLVLSKVRAVARQLLTLEERDPQRVFQGQALMRRISATESSMRTSSVSITCSLSRSRTSWSAGCRPSSSSAVSPRASTTPVCSSARSTSVSAGRSLTSHPSWCVSSPSPTSNSRSHHHSVADVLAVSRGSQVALEVTRMTSKLCASHDLIAVTHQHEITMIPLH